MAGPVWHSGRRSTRVAEVGDQRCANLEVFKTKE
jgi:hypothetical protein